MQLWFWIVLGIVFKLPVAGLCWICWRAITDVPEQVLGDSDGGAAVPWRQGPRLRDPHSGAPLHQSTGRRSNPGHDDQPRPAAPLADHATRG